AGEDREAEGVEGRDGEARVAALELRSEPFAQVGRRLAREGEDEQLLGPGELRIDEPNGALDDDARLPGTRSRECNGRPIVVCDGGQLVWVEIPHVLGNRLPRPQLLCGGESL